MVLGKWLKENSTAGMNSLFQCDCISLFPRFPWESAFFFHLAPVFLWRRCFFFWTQNDSEDTEKSGVAVHQITSLSDPVHGRLCLETGFEVVSWGSQGFTFFGPADCGFEQFLSKKLDTGELQWLRICEAAHLQCFLMSCPGSLGAVLQAGGHSCPAGTQSWVVAQIPGVLRAVRTLSVRAQTSLRAGICAVWPPSGRATCDGCNHVCLQRGLLEGLGAPCVSWHSAAPGVLARWTEVLESLSSQGDREQELKAGRETLLCTGRKK